MKDFNKFLLKNKKKIYAVAEANTTYNTNGYATICSDSEWAKDDVWDNDYEELINSGRKDNGTIS